MMQREKQLAVLQAKISQRRQNSVDEMRSRHDREKMELSSKLLQEGKADEVEAFMKEKEKEQELEMAALQASFDADEAEQIKGLCQSLDKEHVDQVKDAHKDMFSRVSQHVN